MLSFFRLSKHEAKIACSLLVATFAKKFGVYKNIAYSLLIILLTSLLLQQHDMGPVLRPICKSQVMLWREGGLPTIPRPYFKEP